MHCVQLLEDDTLFNSGKGAVFNLEGQIELEASIMVSRGYKKRGAAVSMLRHVKSPIGLAAEMLKHGEVDLVQGGGAQGHSHVSGAGAEDLARKWGLEMVNPDYFWTQKRWDEHERELKKLAGQLDDGGDTRPDGTSTADELPPDYEAEPYIPQGTVGCVVLDQYGTLAVATSTGGLTNKVPGRIGDTPSLGAGFWAEEWMEPSMEDDASPSFLKRLIPSFCMPSKPAKSSKQSVRATAVSGTGNGDSFLRLAAVRTASAKARFSEHQNCSLQDAVSWMIGPGGELQKSAGDRWGKTGEGVGGMIGIEFRNGKGEIVFDFNRGMFRAWVDEDGKEHAKVFKD